MCAKGDCAGPAGCTGGGEAAKGLCLLAARCLVGLLAETGGGTRCFVFGGVPVTDNWFSAPRNGFAGAAVVVAVAVAFALLLDGFGEGSSKGFALVAPAGAGSGSPKGLNPVAGMPPI